MDRDECRGWRDPVKNSVERGVWQGPPSTWAKRGRWWLEGGCDTPGPSSIASYRAFNRSRHNVNIVANWRGVIVTEEGAHQASATCSPRIYTCLTRRHSSQPFRLIARADANSFCSGASSAIRASVNELLSLPPPPSPRLLARSVSPLGLFDGAPLN